MTKYNFDQVIDRKSTHALKVDVLKERFGNEDLIPLWVADMDFMCAPEITDAIIERAKHGIFGYTCATDGYYNSIINWVKNNHNWSVDKTWINFIPGIVKGIAFVIDTFTTENDAIIIQPPVYNPFFSVPTQLKRKIVTNNLVLDKGKYKMNLDDLKNKITPATKILILSNPHNPGGRVWSKRELFDLAEICYDNNVLVIADEIHCDLTFNEHKHIPFASVSEKAKQNSITFMAPSKTFNIAGIVSSFSIIPNNELRNKFQEYLTARELSDGHIFAYVATQAAYEKGTDWLKAVKGYLWQNILFVDNYIKENIPQIKVNIPEASFLVWLDCRDLHLSQEELVSLFVNDAHLALNNGITYGEAGKGYMRLNVGSAQSVIAKALENLKNAINK